MSGGAGDKRARGGAKGGSAAVAAVLDGAAAIPPLPPPPRSNQGLPKGAPIEALGMDGDVYYFLDWNKQLRPLRAEKMSALNISSLCGDDIDWLYEHWPRYSKEGKLNGWDSRKCAEVLMAACALKGIWQPLERERGLGAWRGEGGELILHCGDAVLFVEADGASEAWHAPGLIGGRVYPAGRPLPRPMAMGRTDTVGAELLELLERWSFKRSEIDARLLLGWIAAAMLGGALDWRPVVWLTGGRGTGKSTLHRLLEHVLDGAVIQASDSSAAGLWQMLQRSSLPVACDELEAEEQNDRALAVVKLARQAASGGLVLRGGADHKATAFTVRSAFLFSSILIPPLLGQDRSRLAILELAELDRRAGVPDLEPKRLHVMGSRLRRRLVEGWPRLGATLELYRASLAAMGHSARAADQFGTLLACADLLLFEGPPTGSDLDDVLGALVPERLGEVQDDESDESQCLMHLLTSLIDPWRNGQRNTVGAWLGRLTRGDLAGSDLGEVNRALGFYGMRVMGKPEAIDGVVVANMHGELAKLFEGKRWAGKGGTVGVWVQALRRLPGARAADRVIWVGGAAMRVTWLPWSIIRPLVEEVD